MQIYALDTHSTLIHAHSALRKNTYQCPECQGLLRLRGGHMRQLHFYHVEPGICHHQGKSATHLHIQYALQHMIGQENILLEHRFPDIGRIADVVWPAKKLIFEVQVSPISAEEVRLRNHDYKKMGYTVIWILHDRRFNRTQVSNAEVYLRSKPHYFTNINTMGKGIFYDQYAVIRFKRRVKRSNRFPVRFKQVIPLNLKQLPRQFPLERKKWHISFEGDLFQQHHTFDHALDKPLFSIRPVLHFYKIFLHFLLEKTSY